MMTDQKRKQLATKLTTLIAVLNVAITKLEAAKASPDADIDRLDKLMGSLENTLNICRRALTTLQNVSSKRVFKPSPSGAREYAEMSSVDEYRKFKQLPPISVEEVANTNIDALLKELLP